MPEAAELEEPIMSIEQFVGTEAEEPVFEYLPTSIYDQHQQTLFQAELHDLIVLAALLPEGEGKREVLKSRSALYANQARFELRRGQEDEARAYALQITQFADKVMLFKAAVEQESTSVLMLLGDLRSEAEANQDATGLASYLIAEIAVGYNIHRNTDHVQVLLQDRSLIDGMNAQALEKRLWQALYETAVRQVRQGKFEEARAINTGTYWQAVESCIQVEEARNLGPYTKHKRKSVRQYLNVMSQRFLNEREKAVVTGNFLCFVARGYPEDLIGFNFFQKMHGILAETNPQGLEYLRTLLPKLSQGHELNIAQLYKDQPNGNDFYRNSPPVRALQVYLRWEKLEEAENYYANLANGNGYNVPNPQAYIHDQPTYISKKATRQEVMLMAQELALLKNEMKTPDEELFSQCVAELEVMAQDRHGHQAVLMDDLIDQSRFRTEFNTRISALHDKIGSLKYLSQKFELLSALLAFQKQHDTGAASSFHKQCAQLKAVAKACLSNPVALMAISESEIRETCAALDITLD